MDSKVKNFLYRNPQYYEIIYPEPGEETPKMCMRMFDRFLDKYPGSILDIGCGTGRDLDVLHRICSECYGVDYLPEMVEYAKKTRPYLKICTGDMRTVRLGRAFDCIMCMGSAFMYALSNEDVEKVILTFTEHSHKETLLIIDINNAAGFLGGKNFKEQFETNINLPEFTARSVSTISFDYKKQLFIRKRIWYFDKDVVEDYCEYRMYFPQELRHLLEEKNYEVKGMYDNKELQDTDLSGQRLYIAAVYKG